MPCWSCPGTVDFAKVKTICRVCELLDNDTNNKPVTYCELCKAYICEGCYSSPIRRANAAILNLI